MVQHFMTLLSLSHFRMHELVTLVLLIYMACFFVGLMIDFVVDHLAFGPLINSALLFSLFASASAIYTTWYQPVRATDPATMMISCLGGAFLAFFVLAVFKNRQLRN